MTLLTPAQATRAVRFTGTMSSDQTSMLTDMIAALTPALERACGPIEQATRTWYIASYGLVNLVLPWPFVSVTSLVADGVTVASNLYDGITKAASGMIIPAAFTQPPWQYRYSTLATVQVGSAAIPSNITLAAELLIQAWWQQVYNGRGPASEPLQWTPPNCELPGLVMQALGSAYPMPGFA